MIKTCLNCNKPVNNIVEPELCKKCEIELLKKLRDYIANHPDNNIMVISEQTGISLTILNYLINRERLHFTSLKKCNLCGVIVSINENYCSKCKSNLCLQKNQNDNSSLYNKPKMHYLGRKR